MALDPVCNMEVKEEEAAGHTSYDGTDYYFCSRDCEEKFTHSPGEYVKSEAA